MNAVSRSSCKRRMRRAQSAWLALLFALSISLPAQAQVNTPGDNSEFDRLSVDQGLSQVTVMAITQDRMGFMWFGTIDGLNRYDGYDFTVYRYDATDPHSLGGNAIQALYADSEGMVWIGTDGGGLSRFDPATEQFTRFANDPDDPHSLGSDSVFEIYEDRAGTLWVGTFWDGGLHKFDRATEQFTRYEFSPDDPDGLWGDGIFAIHEDQNGVLWIGSEGGGLQTFDQATETFTHYMDRPDDAHSLDGETITAIEEDQAGALWIGTYEDGLNRLDPKTGAVTYFKPDPDREEQGSLWSETVWAICTDPAGTVWIATNMGGLHRYEPATGDFVHYVKDARDPRSLSGDTIRSVYADEAGVLWAGTELDGLAKLDRAAKKFALYRNDPDDPNTLFENNIHAVSGDQDGVLWVSTMGQLNRVDRTTGTITRYLPDENDPEKGAGSYGIAQILVDRAGDIWLGTFRGGLKRFDPVAVTNSTYLPESDVERWSANVVYTLYETSSGEFWVGTYSAGLFEFDRIRGEFVAHYQHDPGNSRSLPNNLILTAYEDSTGAMWFGTGGGLSRLDRRTQEFTTYPADPEDSHSLSNASVTAIVEDQAGVFWIGTADGLNRFDPGLGQVTARYGEKEGMPNGAIAAILKDNQGYLWVSTGRGLSRFDPATGAFRNYGPRDGLQGYEFNRAAAYQNSAGEMFFGGTNGLNAFYPASVHDNPYVPPIVLTDFQLFNKTVQPGPESPLKAPLATTSEIILTYRDYVVSFEFASLHYSYPPNNRYAYVLEGFEKDWNDVGDRRFATYTSLPAGTYTFRAKGTNSDGLWNNQGAAVRVVVTPPFWATWWFRALAVMAVLAIALGAFGLRIRSLRVRQRMLENLVEERTAQLADAKEAADQANQAKSAFLATMSHELRTPLNAILGFAQLLRRDSTLSPAQQENLSVISRSGEHLLGLISEVLDLSKIEAGRAVLNVQPFDLHGLLTDLENMFLLRAKDKGLTLLFDRAPSVPRYVRADVGKLRQVLINLLGNAVKFTSEGGVTLRIGAVGTGGQEVRLLFEVEDTGPGIAASEQDGLFSAFVQTEAGRKAQEGTGLGLRISQQYVRLMGGTISVRSTVGQGSAFRFDLPVALASAADVPSQAPRRRVVGLAPGQAVYRVLVVEDQWANRSLLVKLLQPLGFEVREACDGQEGVATWESWKPHLILMDMRMPVMDGYEATRRIKATLEGQATAIVALTASAFEEDRTTILAAGCDDFVRKPFREDDIFDRLSQHLGVRFLYEEAAPAPVEPAEVPEALAPSLAVLPATWRAEMEQAVVQADLDQMLALIEQIRPENPSLANTLADWAQNFQYDRLLAWIRHPGEAAPP